MENKQKGFPMKKVLFILLVMLSLVGAETINTDAGITVANQYIWRGQELQSGVVIQPTADISFYGVHANAWASYSAQSTTYNEIDLGLFYKHECKVGTLTVGGLDVFNSQNTDTYNYSKKGPHILEVGGSYTLNYTNTTVTLNNQVLNDPDNSWYLKVSQDFAVGENTLTLFGDGTFDDSKLYNTTGAAVLDLGINVTRNMMIGERKIPITIGAVTNPYQKQTWIIGSVGF